MVAPSSSPLFLLALSLSLPPSLRLLSPHFFLPSFLSLFPVSPFGPPARPLLHSFTLSLISCSRIKGIKGGGGERNDRWGAGAKALKRERAPLPSPNPFSSPLSPSLPLPLSSSLLSETSSLFVSPLLSERISWMAPILSYSGRWRTAKARLIRPYGSATYSHFNL